jgi:uncharacterized protein (DUF342 family)
MISTTVGDIYRCNQCGLMVYGTHICSSPGSDSWTTNTWNVSYDKEIAEALERIADSLEKIEKRLKKLTKYDSNP